MQMLLSVADFNTHEHKTHNAVSHGYILFLFILIFYIYPDMTHQQNSSLITH